MTIEFGNWRISQKKILFLQSWRNLLSIRSHVSISLWQSVGASERFFLQHFVAGIRNEDLKILIHPKIFINLFPTPPKKNDLTPIFFGQEFTTTARCLVWFRGISAKNQWGSPPIRHCQTWTCTICLTHQWATCSHPALWWLIAWNCGVQYEQICDFHLVGGRHPNSRPMGAKKVAKLSSVWGANMICYQHPCLGWRPVLIGNKNSPYSRHNS